MSEIITNRYEFLILIDAQDSNPNGDPDNDNRPRVDPDTGLGYISDVAIKRRVRDYVAASRPDEAPNRVYVRHGTNLNAAIAAAREATAADEKARTSKAAKDVEAARRWMLENFYDVRTFGAVMSTGPNAGQVCGPVQVTFARSIEPISIVDVPVTRVADAESVAGHSSAAYAEWAAARDADKIRSMGRKYIVPHAVYRGLGFVNALQAADAGFTRDDLVLLMEALLGMYDLSRTASKGFMSVRGIYLFKHVGRGAGSEEDAARERMLGCAPAQDTLEKVVTVARDDDAMAADRVEVPRRFGHYRVAVDRDAVPPGVELIEVGAPGWRDRI